MEDYERKNGGACETINIGFPRRKRLLTIEHAASTKAFIYI
jgi:hypothetical protein